MAEGTEVILLRWLLVFLALLTASNVSAQSAGDFERRARELPAILSGTASYEDFFSSGFLAAVPPAKLQEISRQLIDQNGAVQAVEKIDYRSGGTGVLELGYEKAIIDVTMTIGPDRPNKVIGLVITGTRFRGDSVSTLGAEIGTLPGKAGFLVQRLDDPHATPMISINADEEFAVGSAFKLWVLGEAARSVKAGDLSWRDVLPLGHRSLPSGIAQKWPIGAPVTLHSLATLMISISDNTATDTVLQALGRDKIGRMAQLMTGADLMRTLPVLTTAEAFALKMPEAADLRADWSRGSRKERARLLAVHQSRLTVDNVDVRKLAHGPAYIDQIEWFASPSEMSRTLDWFRTTGGEEARAILAVNAGITEGEAARFAYVGYKGGSEAGVISMNLLLKTKAGAWYTVTASWNNISAEIDQARFVGLVSRVVALIP